MNEPVCIIRFYPYPQESHVRRDAECLRDAGHEVDVIAARAGGEKARETVDGVRVYRLPVSPGMGSALGYVFRYLAFFVLCFFVLSTLQFKKRYRVIEVDTMPDFLVFATVIPKLLGARIVLYLFEAMPELFSARLNLSRKTFVVRILKAVERSAVWYADHVITVNEMHKALVSKRCAAKRNISVILNVPDEERLRTSPPTSPPREKFQLIYHGTIAKRYGVHTAIRALALVREKAENIHLVVLGGGDYKEYILELTRELRLEDRVDFIDWVPFENLVQRITEVQVGLVPFIRDGYTDLMLPNKLFEYIALGVPVVAARTRAISDTYDETCLAFFNPGDEADLARVILELYKDPARRENMVEEARQVYETNHRWALIKKQYMGIYKELLETNEQVRGEVSK